MKKILSLVLALCMVLAISASFAAPTAFEKGSITVENASKGETYYIIKAIDAVVSEDGITYSTTIPDQLKSVIDVVTHTVNVLDGEGNTVGTRTYQAVEATTTDKDAIQAAMRAFANAHKGEWGDGVECTGNSVKFDNLAPGYYVIVSSLKTKDQTIETNKVSAGSTYNGDDVTPHTADGIVYEKNDTDVELNKDADDESYSIGDTVTYTVEFKTKNYMVDANGEQKIITKFEVKDTLPPFLSNAAVTKIQIGTTEYAGNDLSEANFPGITTFATGKKFDIAWADLKEGTQHDWTSKYTNGTAITITYTAVLTDEVNVNAANTNRISITPYVDTPDGPEPWDEPWEDTEVITTYAAAVKKVDEDGNALTGAIFKFAGLKTEKTADGIYTVVSTTADEENETLMEVGPDGILYIVGLKEGKELTGTETKAPDGYNLLTSTFKVIPQVMTKEIYKESGHRWYDADGNLIAETSAAAKDIQVEKNLSELDPGAVQVINQKGTELPSTGGIGTTIFYVLGGLLVVGAAIILVARRKAHD